MPFFTSITSENSRFLSKRRCSGVGRSRFYAKYALHVVLRFGLKFGRSNLGVGHFIAGQQQQGGFLFGVRCLLFGLFLLLWLCFASTTRRCIFLLFVFLGCRYWTACRFVGGTTTTMRLLQRGQHAAKIVHVWNARMMSCCCCG